VVLLEPSRLLRAFAWARLALAGLLLVTVPLTASEFAPVANVPILALALLVTAASSAAILFLRAVPNPGRVAALISALDVALITAVVTATGGPRSIYPFLYVLSVTGACALLPRVGALGVAAFASLLYSGVVFGRTVFPIAYFFETPVETTALEVVTIFLNSATFLVVAILVGGVAERYRAAHRELETRQRDLRDLEAFRDLVFECVGTGLIVLDRGDRVTAFNRAAEEITGRSGSAILGSHWQDIAGDGVDLAEIVTALDTTSIRSVRNEAIVYRPNGEAVPVLMTFSTLRSAAGAPLGLVAACEDLSTIRRMEARMRQADRLASLGRMSANIAHEIRNPLASMTGAIEALTANSSVAHDDRARLTEIVMRESDRLNGILSDFLAYARPRPLSVERIDVAGVLEEVLMLLEHRPLPPNVKAVRMFEAPLWAYADPNALRQALWNLCLNALDAMPDGGELTVGATLLPSTLQLSVADTGGGIAPGDLSHIFEPFYSTKPEGSGLGLALVHRIVRDHDGDVEVRTDRQTGTVFTLTLPLGLHA
jgi:two-component system sensor histidine kinase PilS (NtrC family)